MESEGDPRGVYRRDDFYNRTEIPSELSLLASFYLILCIFPIMHLYTTHFPFFCIHPLPLQPPPKNIFFSKKYFKRKKKRKHLHKEAVVWHSKAHSKPFHPCIISCKCSLQSHWNFWFQASGFYCSIDAGSPLGLIFCCCPVSWGSWNFVSAGLPSFMCSSRSQMGGCWGEPTHNPGSRAG